MSRVVVGTAALHSGAAYQGVELAEHGLTGCNRPEADSESLAFLSNFMDLKMGFYKRVYEKITFE
jgi:hypothetical protein